MRLTYQAAVARELVTFDISHFSIYVYICERMGICVQINQLYGWWVPFSNKGYANPLLHWHIGCYLCTFTQRFASFIYTTIGITGS